MIYALLVSILLQTAPSQGVDISAYLSMGCTRVHTTDRNYLDCSAAGLEAKYSCLEVDEVPEYFDNLSPQVPIVECYFSQQNLRKKNDEYVIYRGCGMLPLYSKYIVYDNGQTKELKNQSDVRRFFVPVESAGEALAIAAALTGLKPVYDITVPPGFLTMHDPILPSYSKPSGNGFEVRLFGYECEGCGNHPYYFMTYMVDRDGNLTTLSREDVFRNPKTDGQCQD